MDTPDIASSTNDLVSATRELLRSRDKSQTLTIIATNTGVDINFISRFQKSFIEHPSAHKVQKLWEYLSGRKLEL